jgi:hypothetical protein
MALVERNEPAGHDAGRIAGERNRPLQKNDLVIIISVYFRTDQLFRENNGRNI